MFLKKLVLKNIRCLEHLDLSFQEESGGLRQWTLILGENGAGKSTILQSIALLLAGSEGLRELLDAPESLIRGGTLEGTLRADFVTLAGESKSIELSLRREENLREFFLRNASGLSALDGELKSAPHPYLTVGYGVSRRLSRPQTIPIKPQRFRNPRAQAVATLFDAPSFTPSKPGQ